MIVAVDAVGGDRAPEIVIEGVVSALWENMADKILLVGPGEMIRKRIREYEYPAHSLEIIDAPEIITMDENPRKSLKKKNSSMAVIAELLKNGRAKAAISAGNTGAYFATLMFTLGKIPGVMRPAIASALPTSKAGKPCLLLDLGANVDCKPEYLVQFAYLGHFYMHDIFHVPYPKVGLLNIGHEPAKGNELSQKTYKMLKESKDLNFMGNVEGREIIKGEADIIVCDGFVGNVVLKLMEGVAGMTMEVLKKELTSSLLSKLWVSFLRQHFLNFKKIIDYEEYGGAPLLGIDGIGIKCHGSSGPRAIKNAIRVARECVENDFSSHLRTFFGTIHTRNAE